MKTVFPILDLYLYYIYKKSHARMTISLMRYRILSSTITKLTLWLVLGQTY